MIASHVAEGSLPLERIVVRPAHLPDFANPPLHEVVLGVQFEPVAGYRQILAGDVWRLFRDRYPLVEEHPPLPPIFETFGLPPIRTVDLELVTGARHDRFWFVSQQKDELIQFQQDRLLHNWRKVGEQANPYPRFERMVESFHGELILLREYLAKLSSRELSINQCEITYVNQIYIDATPGLTTLSQWFSFLKDDKGRSEDVGLVFRTVIASEDKRPFGRLICELMPSIGVAGRPFVSLTLTVRGPPPAPGVAAALDFLAMGREKIVETFADITTESAHRVWGRMS